MSSVSGLRDAPSRSGHQRQRRLRMNPDAEQQEHVEERKQADTHPWTNSGRGPYVFDTSGAKCANGTLRRPRDGGIRRHASTA